MISFRRLKSKPMIWFWIIVILAALSAVLISSRAIANEAASQVEVAFDGKVLYQRAFESVRDRHLNLLDKNKRATWSQEWESKFANSPLLDTEKGTDEAIQTMLASLGVPYDRFLGSDYAAVADALEKGSATIGVLFHQRMVMSLDTSGPTPVAKRERIVYVGGFEAGSTANGVLQYGDVFLEIGCVSQDLRDNTGCKSIAEMSPQDVGLATYGPEDSTVIVTIKRFGPTNQPQVLRVSLIRKELPKKVVFVSKLPGGETLIRVTDFLPNDFEKQFEEALKQAGDKVIIDLRGNPGGRTEASVNAVGMILVNGKILVTQVREGDSLTRDEIRAAGQFFMSSRIRGNLGTAMPVPRPQVLLADSVKVAVIIDERSASASEIFAGALQANKRARIVGKKSVGKGIGQEIIGLPFNRRVHVTTFEFRPGGIAHDGVGIVPDVEVDKGTADDLQLKAAVDAVNE